MKKISARISNEEFFNKHFRSVSGGCEYVLEAFPGLYSRTLHGLKGKLTTNELSLIVDVFNSAMLSPKISGQHLILNCIDGMDLDGLDDKWGVNKAEFVLKLRTFSLLDCACLEIWANGFWYSNTSIEKEELNFEDYIKALL